MELAAWLSTFHGALTVGLTTYPALESRFTLQTELLPAAAVEILAKAPVSKAEPLTLQAGVHLTIWQF